MKEKAFGVIPLCRENSKVEVFLVNQYGSAGDVFWTFPKGRPEKRESSEETAIRECKEETGLDVVLDKERVYPIEYTFTRKGNSISKITTLYVGFVKNKSFTIQPEEIKEASWFSVEEAIQILTFPKHKEALREAVAHLDNR